MTSRPETCVFEGARVFVTGGLGFIGSNLARRLVEMGARVHVFDRLVPEHGGTRFNVAEIGDGLRVTVGDLCDADALRKALGEPDFLFNLAGQGSHWDSMVDPCGDLEINCRAQLTLLECVRAACPEVRMVFASTRQIYGRPNYLPVDEAHPLDPVDVNGVHKIASEGYHRLYANVHGLRCTILRLTNTIGPRMRVKDARQTFAGLWIRLALEGRPFEVWGGEQLRDFNYVDDVVDALLAAAGCERAVGRVYNLGALPAVRLREFAELLRGATGCAYEVRAFPPERRSIDIGDYYASYTRIHNELGWEPRTPLPEAVERTLGYYAAHLHHYV
jgi:UDP-glucose 4-epimerase